MITSLLLAIALAVIPVSNAPRYDIVPTPKSLTPAEGSFTLSKTSSLVVEDEAFAEVASDFRSQVAVSTGFKLDGKASKIVLRKVSGLGKEAYKLSVRPQEVIICASEVNGAFYGLQTLLQLFPAEIYADKLQKKVKWTAPCCIIEDEPEFAYRGFLFDCGQTIFITCISQYELAFDRSIIRSDHYQFLVALFARFVPHGIQDRWSRAQGLVVGNEVRINFLIELDFRHGHRITGRKRIHRFEGESR